MENTCKACKHWEQESKGYCKLLDIYQDIGGCGEYFEKRSKEKTCKNCKYLHGTTCLNNTIQSCTYMIKVDNNFGCNQWSFNVYPLSKL